MDTAEGSFSDLSNGIPGEAHDGAAGRFVSLRRRGLAMAIASSG
jgi:hypothetical protein